MALASPFMCRAGLIPLLKLLTLLLAVLLAACSSAPQRTVRGGSNGASPAEELLEKYHGPWQGSVEPVFTEYAY